MTQVGGRQDTVNAEPQTGAVQHFAMADDTIGLMQVGEHQVVTAVLLLVGGNRAIQHRGAACQLGQLTPRRSTVVAEHLIINAGGDRVVADVPQ
ncbi:hypothetical protein D3C78_1628280 [compost metagenome]